MLVKGKVFNDVMPESQKIYMGCTFYFSENYFSDKDIEIRDSVFANCSFRSPIQFGRINNCEFTNTTFSSDVKLRIVGATIDRSKAMYLFCDMPHFTHICLDLCSVDLIGMNGHYLDRWKKVREIIFHNVNFYHCDRFLKFKFVENLERLTYKDCNIKRKDKRTPRVYTQNHSYQQYPLDIYELPKLKFLSLLGGVYILHHTMLNRIDEYSKIELRKESLIYYDDAPVSHIYEKFNFNGVDSLHHGKLHRIDKIVRKSKKLQEKILLY